MPDSEDPTKDPRPSHRASTHGYPLGFAKSQWALRDSLLAGLREREERLGEYERTEIAAHHEAVARALDWERLLGSFNHAGEDRFPVATIDAVADNLLAWLSYQGFRVAQSPSDWDESLPRVESRLPTVFDIARTIVVLVPEDDPAPAGSDEGVVDGTSTAQATSADNQGALPPRSGVLRWLKPHRESSAKGGQ